MGVIYNHCLWNGNSLALHLLIGFISVSIYSKRINCLRWPHKLWTVQGCLVENNGGVRLKSF